MKQNLWLTEKKNCFSSFWLTTKYSGSIFWFILLKFGSVFKLAAWVYWQNVTAKASCLDLVVATPGDNN